MKGGRLTRDSGPRPSPEEKRGLAEAEQVRSKGRGTTVLHWSYSGAELDICTPLQAPPLEPLRQLRWGLSFFTVRSLMSWLNIALLGALVLVPILLLIKQPAPFDPHSPPLAHSRLPLIGSLDFFWRRWDWFADEKFRLQQQGSSGAFSFWLAGWKVVAPAGAKGREYL